MFDYRFLRWLFFRASERARELLGHAVAEEIRHVQRKEMDLVVGGHVSGEVIREHGHCFRPGVGSGDSLAPLLLVRLTTAQLRDIMVNLLQ
jgi:hypothetical protein